MSGCPNCGAALFPLDGTDRVVCTNEDCPNYNVVFRPETGTGE